jgi:hypothetical protein
MSETINTVAIENAANTVANTIANGVTKAITEEAQKGMLSRTGSFFKRWWKPTALVVGGMAVGYVGARLNTVQTSAQ